MTTDPLDLLLLSPTEGQLLSALEQAARRGGMDSGRAPWAPVLLEVANKTEGRFQWEDNLPNESGNRYASVAWWTDHQGRKHVRVAGGNSAAPVRHLHFSRLDQDLRPPLWHAHGDRLFRVTRPGQEPCWVASCACGVTGHPSSVAWMGPCCGPCHDRAEEEQTHPSDKSSALFTLGCRVMVRQSGQKLYGVFDVAFAPDGQSLAVSSSDRHVSLLSLDAQPERKLYSSGAVGPAEEFSPLTFSSDGRFLAAGDPLSGCARVWDLDSGKTTELDFGETSPDEQIVGLAFSPNADLLAVCNREGILRVWRWEGGWKRVHAPRNRAATTLAFTPDGQVLAVGLKRGTVTFKDSSTWRRWRTLQGQDSLRDDILFLHCAGEDRLVVLTGTRSPSGGDHRHTLRRWTLAHDHHEETNLHVPFAISAIAACPDGHTLAWLVHDVRHSPGEVTFWDVERWQEVGRLEWDPEDVLRALTFSTDGQTLATGSAAGVVKLWPWRLLLGV